MAETFYFYDLETSGVSPRKDRIMQFAGQRTNRQLEPIGEPDEFYVKLTKDILPSPEAILLTGITPQKTLEDGITEAEFCRYFIHQIAQPNTIFVGYNNVHFDDEFIRHTLFRNFYDPYEWHWRDNKSRWDILDLIRITRALRPEGINWPFDELGAPSNRLEVLTDANNLEHLQAHTALSDVTATILLAKLVLDKQPKLFDYMLGMRDKNKIKALVTKKEPFAYVNGYYEGRYQKLSPVVMVAEVDDSSALVYDLRYSPVNWLSKSDDEIVKAFNERAELPEDRLPMKVLQYNKCPSVAPYNVIDEGSLERLAIDDKLIKHNLKALKDSQKLVDRVLELMTDRKKSYSTKTGSVKDPEASLYDGFLSTADKIESAKVVDLTTDEIKSFQPKLVDWRLKAIFPLYKARNFPSILSDQEYQEWEKYLKSKLLSGEENALNIFTDKITELYAKPELTKQQRYLLEELRLYGESIIPVDY